MEAPPSGGRRISAMEVPPSGGRRISMLGGRRISTASGMSAILPVNSGSMTAFRSPVDLNRRVSHLTPASDDSLGLEDDFVPPMLGMSRRGSMFSSVNDYSRPFLSQHRGEAVKESLTAVLGHSGRFDQLLVQVAAEHEREVSALKDQLDLMRRQHKVRPHRNSRNSISSNVPEEQIYVHDSERTAEPPTEKPPLLEKEGPSNERPHESPPHERPRDSLTQDRHHLGVPGAAPPVWRPAPLTEVAEHSSPTSREGSDVPGMIPCQVIKVTPLTPHEPSSPKSPKSPTSPISVRLGNAPSVHSLQVQGEVSDGNSSLSHTSSGGAGAHHMTTLETDNSQATQGPRKFTVRVVWEQLSEENNGHMATKRLSYESLCSEDSAQAPLVFRLMSSLVVHPSSGFRLLWNFLAILMLFSDLVTVPLQLFEPPENIVEAVLAVVTLVFWNLDIVANFFVGFWEKGAAVMKPRRIAKHYARTWLLPDLCLVSLDWVLMVSAASDGTVGGARASRVMRVLRGLRYLRLLRLLKTKQMLAKTQVLMSEISSVRFSIGKLIVFILVINHLIGCFWWGVGTLECGGRSWTYEFRERSLQYRYLTSFHWSMSQFGVGNVEIEAVSTCERIFCIFVLLFALIAFSSLVSSITNAMAHLQRLNDRETQLSLFQRYCNEQQVSSQLMYRMIQHVNAVLDQQRQSIAAVDVSFLKLLSEPLFDELQREIYESYLRVHPFFTKVCTLYVACTRALCRHTLSTMFLAPRDLLFHPCQVAHRMYFVECGNLRYTRSQDSQTSVEVTPPEWFSEAVLWTRWLYYGHMQAMEPCELVALGVEQFQEVIKMHPESLRVLKRYARRFVERLNDTDERDLTDLSAERNTTPFARSEAKQKKQASFAASCWCQRLVNYATGAMTRRMSNDSMNSMEEEAARANADRWSDRGSEEADDNARVIA